MRRGRPRAPRSRPTRRGRRTSNFVGEPTDPATFYTHATYARLRAIRAAVDPHGLMVANHPIPAA